MLFVLNTVSVLTLIDVPVCFLLLLQTESTHKSGYYRLGGVRLKEKKRKKAFSAAFSAGPFVSVSFPLFCAGGQRQQRQESKVKRWKENEKKQDGLRGREYTVGDGGGNKRTFHRGRTHSQFSHTIGKPLSDRMRFFQPVSNHRYHK